MSANIQLNYHRSEDRLILALEDEAGVQRFWITRSQCIGLAAAFDEVQGKMPALKVAPALKESVAQTELVGDLVSRGEKNTPQLVRLALRKVAQGLRLSLMSEASVLQHLLLKPADQLSLLRMLRHLASKAQWDLDAAELRAASNAVIRKARRLH